MTTTTSETAPISLHDLLGERDTLTIGHEQTNEADIVQDITITRSGESFVATSGCDVMIEGEHVDERDLADFLRSRYTATSCSGYEHTESGSVIEARFAARLGCEASSDQVVEAIIESGLGDVSTDAADGSLPTRLADWLNGYDGALARARSHYSRPECFDVAVFREQYIEHEGHVRRDAERYETLIEP